MGYSNKDTEECHNARVKINSESVSVTLVIFLENEPVILIKFG